MAINLALKAGAHKAFGNGRPDGQLILPLAKGGGLDGQNT